MDEINEVNKSEKLWNRTLPVEMVILSTFITTWMTYEARGVITTIPLIIILPFILRLFFKNGLLIVSTAFISSFILGMTKDNIGYGMFLIAGIVIGTFSGVILAKGIKSADKTKRMAWIVIGIGAVLLAGINYNATWGNPLGYIQAKIHIEEYINKNYEGRLEIKSMERNFLKDSGYDARVVRKDDTRDTSTIYYGDNDYLEDRYHFDTVNNMMDQVTTLLTSLIDNQTDLTDYDINLKADVEVPVAKYNLHDRFQGDEPVSVDVQLQPDFSWRRKDGQKRAKIYINKEAFAEDAYKVITVLQNAGYNYNSIKAYYYLEEGNTTYEVILKKGETIHSLEEIINRTQKVNASK